MARSSQRSANTALPQPTAAEVRAHLDALLHNEALAISERNRRFLAYIVEETLGGRGDRIKAYNVALTAFDRTDDFDPQTDPIVRIEASRLRRALEHYYLTAGKSDPLRIGVPKGSYVATFSYAVLEPVALPEGEGPVQDRAQPKTAARWRIASIRKPPIWWIASLATVALVTLAWILPLLLDHAVGRAKLAQDGPSILILPFEVTGSDNQAYIAHGLSAEVIGRLTRLESVSVLDDNPTGIMPATEPDYVLSGSTHVVGSTVYISAALTESRTGRYLWSWNVERRLGGADLIGVEAAIAGEIIDGIRPLIHTTQN
jgi:TolB-like protein